MGTILIMGSLLFSLAVFLFLVWRFDPEAGRSARGAPSPKDTK
jgi:hypothetical protein